MRLSYERPHPEDDPYELTYEECLRIVNSLEAVRRLHLTNSAIAKRATGVMQRDRIRNLPRLNQVIEDMALGDRRDQEEQRPSGAFGPGA